MFAWHVLTVMDTDGIGYKVTCFALHLHLRILHTQTEEGILRSQLSDLTSPRREPHHEQGDTAVPQAPSTPSVSDADLIQGKNLPTLNLGTDKPRLALGGHLQRKSLVDMESEIEEEDED